ncbi:MAG: capsular biosynthesis protein [Gemmatimonadetes bacterium]|nr:capsular biosynthesis protein [Gemmatimonadota bacterium]
MSSPARVAIDLDGTICALKRDGESYADLAPLPGAAERVRALRAAGCYVIIITARNMKTCEGNLGRVMKNVGKITLDWLERHDIEYDEIYFGKANAHIYIDDRAHRFHSWDEITPALIEREAREQ